MGQDEGRRMERRIRPPPALPVRIVLPARRTELVGAHDLGADPGFMTGREGMVGADGPGGLRPEPGGEHPFVKPLAGVAERRFRGLGLAGGKAVERNGQIVDAGAGHREVLSGGRLSACIPNDERRPTVSTSRRARRSGCGCPRKTLGRSARSEEHTSELQSLMRISYAVFCLKKKQQTQNNQSPDSLQQAIRPLKKKTT